MPAAIAALQTFRQPAAPRGPSPLLRAGGAPLQRKCACGGGTDGECQECRGTAPGVQRFAAGAGPSRTAPPLVHEVLGSPGRPLDPATRAFMEPRFGHDFSQVRVHTDGRAAESARAVAARAYTVGSAIVFAAGQYAPASGSGRRLLAHELAHTIQQSPGRAAGGGNEELPVNEPGDAFEAEADAVAARVLDGGPPPAVRPGAAGLQRAADPDKVPPGLPCVTDAVPGSDEGTNLARIEVNTANLTAKHKKEIVAFVDDWVKGGSSDFIFAEGYASIDGPSDYTSRQHLNWRLSCDRAEAAQNEMIRRGVPAAKIITIAHGETTQFSPRDLAENRRVVLSTLPMPAPPPPTEEVPQKKEVVTKSPGDLDKEGHVKKQPELEQKTTSKQDVPVQPVTDKDEDRLFSLTVELDIANNWSFAQQPPQPPNPFLCDHGVFQLGGKINVGIKLGKSGRFEALNEPEIDVNLIPPFCGGNPGVTAQVNLLKFKILKDVLETDLVGVLGLPDNWATNLPDFPFGGGFQGKLQWTPFGAGHSALKNFKIGIFGNLQYQQGVTGQVPSWQAGGGLFIGHDFDFGPKKAPEKE
jgi:outer membrane protein OmpA-like peptidoglycan-associated protein